MKFKDYSEDIEIPAGIDVKISNGFIEMKGQKGEAKRMLKNPKISVSAQPGKIKISTPLMTKREKKVIGTFRAHIKNMIKGVTEGHEYKMKICSGHFPMNVSISKDQFIVKNFLGEKVPRTVGIPQEVTVKIDGNDVIIQGSDKEKCGIAASRIELLTRRSGFDKRIFQDGIYITDKDGKEIK